MEITLYDKLKKNLKETGYEVKEGSWIEPVGYKKPTREYWLDVTLKVVDNVKYIMHYYFKNDKDNIEQLQFWKCDLVITEENHKQIC